MAEPVAANPFILFLAPLYSWRAARGAKRMDRKAPGWHQRIDKSRLKFNDPCDCIIGQGVGKFNDNVTHIVDAVRGLKFTFGVIGNGFACGYTAALATLFRSLFMDRVECPSPRRLKMAWVYQIDKRLAAAD